MKNGRIKKGVLSFVTPSSRNARSGLVWFGWRSGRCAWLVGGTQMTTALLRGWLAPDRMQRHRQSRPLPRPLSEEQGPVSAIRLSRGLCSGPASGTCRATRDTMDP